jgi:NADH dehydrogenase/NADH:ubiquinone oxidoreductase subunit G
MVNGHVLPQRQFTVVQAAYRSALTEAADVVLPARIWAEQKGHVVNMEGRTLEVRPLLDAPNSIQSDWETILRLGGLMGSALSFDAISEMSLAV